MLAPRGWPAYASGTMPLTGMKRAPWAPWVLAVTALALGAAGCTNLRYYSTYKYQHVRTETVRKPLKQHRYLSGIFREGGAWVLKVMELRRCEQQEVEIARETAHVTISSPTWFYFVGLGGLQAGLSIPFWILGARADNNKDRRDNYLVGSLIFLVPGLAILALGTYFKLVSGTEKKKMGLKRRVKHTTEVACGTAPAEERRVTLGTRTGPVALGRTDGKGQLRFPAGKVRPLVRWDSGKVAKDYFEVFVEDAASVEVKVPKGFPVHPADLREPSLKGGYGSASGAAPSPRPASPRPATRAPARPAPRPAARPASPRNR